MGYLNGKTPRLVNLTPIFLLQVFILILSISLAAAAEMSKKVDHHHVKIGHDGYPSWFSKSDKKNLSHLQKGDKIHPNITVAKDGTGQFKKIADAINSYPNVTQGTYTIYIKGGIYDEYINVDAGKKNILLYGDGPSNTIITGRKNANEGLKMPQTSTFTTFAVNFIVKSIAFENTAGPEGAQAVALRVVGDHSAFFNCTFRGYQDTLYVDRGFQFYSHCNIYGTIDFIFGRSNTLIQRSQIWVRKPIHGQDNVVVADGTYTIKATTGIVLQKCSIRPDAELKPFVMSVKTYLARPWGNFSKAVFIENYMDGFIDRDGYRIWAPNDTRNATTFFVEFGNVGSGANASARVKWSKGVIKKDEAFKFTAEKWINASTWVPSTGIPYDPGF